MTFKYRWPEWHFRDNWSHISAFFSFFSLFFFHHFRKQKVSMCIFETLNPFWAKKVGKLVAKPPPFTFTSIAMDMVQREDARVCLFLVSLTHAGAAVHEPGANQMQLVCHRNHWVRATLAFFYSCHCLAGKKTERRNIEKEKNCLHSHATDRLTFGKRAQGSKNNLFCFLVLLLLSINQRFDKKFGYFRAAHIKKTQNESK